MEGGRGQVEGRNKQRGLGFRVRLDDNKKWGGEMKRADKSAGLQYLGNDLVCLLELGRQGRMGR